ncbi:MAG: amidophosphoribosyltransferase [Candidatus Tectomicrobia bacterium]|uniref:Amidophosphoribosyltransferase n=1 Tax=Tectimicrobiota bacterium TaxID=2528274 RepID=A0A932I112_UNCTE|nr:amidophosphoribosyltransferase [Candidatus Tectomicrobia bacterium]
MTPFDDHPHEECAVFGIYGHPEAANLTYLGLYALQHRGQESSGIVASDGERVHSEVGMGHVADIFTEARLDRLKGHLAIGHNRYSTAGQSHIVNAQPFLVTYSRGIIALGHNGNLVNAGDLRRELEATGSIFRSTTDSEVILHLIARSLEQETEGAIVDALNRLEGAFTLMMMTRDKLVGVRDPNGFRPLVLGRMSAPAGGEVWVLASETCALDLIEADFVREVAPGEMIVVDEEGLHSMFPFPPIRPTQCIFEFIYFARPDSYIFGENVYTVRRQLGVELARESPVDADIVIPVPDSGLAAALGYSAESGLPLEWGLVRNHYVGRTFIEPQQSIRHFGVKVKLNPMRAYLDGKRVVVVDDSIVRGTTSRKIVEMIRKAGASEVHMRISSPPITHPCFFGIDMPTRKELIASAKSVEETRLYLNADSLAYLSLEGLLRCVHPRGGEFCAACFTGNYPIPVHRVEPQLWLFQELKASEHRA